MSCLPARDHTSALKDIFSFYLNVEVWDLDSLSLWIRTVRTPAGAEKAGQFKDQLRHALNHPGTVTPEIFEKWTDCCECETQEEVQQQLQEVWDICYGPYRLPTSNARNWLGHYLAGLVSTEQFFTGILRCTCIWDMASVLKSMPADQYDDFRAFIARSDKGDSYEPAIQSQLPDWGRKEPHHLRQWLEANPTPALAPTFPAMRQLNGYED